MLTVLAIPLGTAAWTSSAEISSISGDFPVLNCFTACSTSESSGGGFCPSSWVSTSVVCLFVFSANQSTGIKALSVKSDEPHAWRRRSRKTSHRRSSCVQKRKRNRSHACMFTSMLTSSSCEGNCLRQTSLLLVYRPSTHFIHNKLYTIFDDEKQNTTKNKTNKLKNESLVKLLRSL